MLPSQLQHLGSQQLNLRGSSEQRYIDTTHTVDTVDEAANDPLT